MNSVVVQALSAPSGFTVSGVYGWNYAGSRAGSGRRADVIAVNQGTHTDCRLSSETLRVPGPSPEGALSHDDDS